jgi:hypothetical protein
MTEVSRPWGDLFLRNGSSAIACGTCRRGSATTRPQCEDRQVPKARVALVASGPFPQCRAMVLTAV